MLTAAARAQCTHAFPNGTNGLQCQSFGSTPPCVGGDGKFFATPFTGLHRRSGLHGSIRGRYAQCYGRPRDEDWPFLHDPWARSGPQTRTVSDLDAVLGDRVITFVGASDTAHTMQWINCHLARVGLLQPKGCRWKHWGWAKLSEDNCQCEADTPGGMIGCSAAATQGYSLETMLNASDVVVISYNPQHSRTLATWNTMLDVLVPRLHAFASTPGKAAFFREPGAQHFAQGAYSPGDELKISSCRPYNMSAAALVKHNGGERGDLNYQAALATREAVARLPSSPPLHKSRVAVLPFFDESARRFNMHIGDTSSCKAGKGCPAMTDCLHWCYTPQFLDNSLFTPLVHGLRRADRSWSHAEWAAAAAEGGAAARAADKNSSARLRCEEASTPRCWGNTGLGVYWGNKAAMRNAAAAPNANDALTRVAKRGGVTTTKPITRQATLAQHLMYPGK
uniref:Uncharacterized protein n=1 Tax=Phaeocystis antarctica TaxID=33657 RepID=A0A7S0E836_9EUKA|mmetsp:Transcript_15988/g.37898  ORF Transcript_15988/g.37898 Transcript_15988/m.37898 type:complete len:451 (+) Transcript_15988:33-1385(+)